MLTLVRALSVTVFPGAAQGCDDGTFLAGRAILVLTLTHTQEPISDMLSHNLMQYLILNARQNQKIGHFSLSNHAILSMLAYFL